MYYSRRRRLFQYRSSDCVHLHRAFQRASLECWPSSLLDEINVKTQMIVNRVQQASPGTNKGEPRRSAQQLPVRRFQNSPNLSVQQKSLASPSSRSSRTTNKPSGDMIHVRVRVSVAQGFELRMGFLCKQRPSEMPDKSQDEAKKLNMDTICDRWTDPIYSHRKLIPQASSLWNTLHHKISSSRR